MKIIELNISEFGGLKGVRITPSDRLNVIYGENESGKSTVLLFIKFMLYGLGRKSTANIERERSISWSGHTAAGSMSFSHDSKTYRIERRYIEGGRESKSVICLDDGKEINTDKTPGEYFLGVPKEVFESSACIGQMRSADINGEKTAASIQNMLTSADESVDTAKILKNLDAVRVTYRHKSKAGGSLYDREIKISKQKQRLDAARDASLRVDAISQKLEVAQADIEVAARDLESTDALVTQINKISVLKRFEKLRSDREAAKELSSRKKELCKASLKTDFFPDNRYMAQLKLTADSLSEAEEHLAEKLASRDESISEYDGELADIGERLEQAGGTDIVLRTIEDKKKKAKKHTTAVMTVWVIEALLAIGGAVALVAGFPWGAALFAFLPVAVVMTVKGAKEKKKVDNEINALAAQYSATADNFSQKATECMTALSLRRAHLSLTASQNAQIAEAQKTLDKYKSYLGELLSKICPDIAPTAENAKNEYVRMERFLAEHERLSKDEETLTRFISTEEDALRLYDEKKLREEITVDIGEVTPIAVSEAERRKKFLAYQKTVLEQRANSLNSELISLKATAEDPLLIADELAELEAEQARDEEFYSALTLAMEAIGQAGQVMSGSVTPAIAAHASEIMARISKDKYTTLRTTSTLDVSLDSDGFGIKSDFLSGGTRDAAYLSLRVALFMRIYGDNIPPIVMDEALCQFDDTRAERMLMLLATLANDGVQILFFTSHQRERDTCERNSIEFEYISL